MLKGAARAARHSCSDLMKSSSISSSDNYAITNEEVSNYNARVRE